MSNLPINLRRVSELGREIGGQGSDRGTRTIKRRIKTDPDFPQVYSLNGRGYVEADDWERYKRVLMQRGLQKADRALPPAASRHSTRAPPVK